MCHRQVAGEGTAGRSPGPDVCWGKDVHQRDWGMRIRLGVGAAELLAGILRAEGGLCHGIGRVTQDQKRFRHQEQRRVQRISVDLFSWQPHQDTAHSQK